MSYTINLIERNADGNQITTTFKTLSDRSESDAVRQAQAALEHYLWAEEAEVRDEAGCIRWHSRYPGKDWDKRTSDD